MNYHVIDLSNDPRREHFALFSSMQNPYVGVTMQVDITAFLQSCCEKAVPFYLSFFYCATRAANAVPELRRRILNGQVIEYDWCIPSGTVLRQDGSYSYCVQDCTLPFEEYLPKAIEAHQYAKEYANLDDGEDALNLIFISCLPWLHYTSFTQPTPVPADSNLRLTWGKYAEENGKTTLPFTLLANHALVDGLHIARFFQALDEELAAFTKKN